MQRVFKEDIRPILEDSDQFLMRSVWDILTEYQVDMNWDMHICDWKIWVTLFTSTCSGYKFSQIFSKLYSFQLLIFLCIDNLHI